MVRPETHFRRIEDSVSQEDNVMTQRYFVLTFLWLLLIGLVPYAEARGAPEVQEVSLSLREAVDMALENNLDIVVSRLNTATACSAVLVA